MLSRLMIYFFLLMASTFRLMGCVETPIIHDFLDAVGFFFRPRRPPPWGWCGLSFSFFDPHGLPLFFADPVDFTISTEISRIARGDEICYTIKICPWKG